MAINNLQEDFKKTVDEFIYARTEAVEGALMQDESSQYNQYSAEVKKLTDKLILRLDKTDVSLLLDFDSANNAKWIEVIHASYIQGLKDGIKLNGITSKALCLG